VHRDFKAANAIVQETGRLTIVDFGLARREDPLIGEATTVRSFGPAGTIAGTPYSMAPEQASGAPLTPRTDQWALGVMLFEMVSGGKPFTGATAPELFVSILTRPAAPLPLDVPTALRTVIARCLEKEPQRRFDHVADVATELRAIRSGTTSPTTARPLRSRYRPLLAVAAALVLALGVTLGLRAWLIGRGHLAAIKLAVLPFGNLTGDPAQEYFSDGLTQELITELGRLNPAALSVTARTSSMRYKDGKTPLDEVGRQLGVD
jgi:eukaryotic-like serine/threonine-protein kinase